VWWYTPVIFDVLGIPAPGKLEEKVCKLQSYIKFIKILVYHCNLKLLKIRDLLTNIKDYKYNYHLTGAHFLIFYINQKIFAYKNRENI
jgi:hypothetical protein